MHQPKLKKTIDIDVQYEWKNKIPNEEFRGRTDMVGVLVIPSRIQNIGAGAFHGCAGITELRLSDTLTEIGAGAFHGCSGLTGLRLPDSLVEIGAFAFYGCSGLTEVWLPDTLTEIGAGAFEECSGLTELNFPDTLAKIGCYAFRYCTGLTELRLPDTLTEIGEGAFSYCSGLTELRLPGSIKSLGSYAFYLCKALQLVSMNSVIQFEYDEDFGPQAHFWGCTSLKAIYAPSEVSLRFTEDMFEDCGTPVSTLLANATPDLGLWYYWTPKNYQLCSLVSKEVVFTLLLVNNRLNIDSELKKTKNNLELEKKDVSRGLPIELWYEILSFVCRHQLGSK